MGTTNPNYVQFIRGTPTAWQNLKQKNENVLYFISEKDSITGQLYLGSKLIAGSGSIKVEKEPIAIRDLTDVSLSLSISDGSVLFYDRASGCWINKEIPIMSGAKSQENGSSGLVPAPSSGQETYFLSGSGDWVDLGGDLEAYMMTLYGSDETSQSIREIAASEVGKILGSSVPEDYNTLEKIANWIMEKGTAVGDETGIARVSALEKSVYGSDKTGKTDGIQKDVDDMKKIINGYQVDEANSYAGLRPITDQLQGDVIDLQSVVSTLQNKYQSMNSTVTDLNTRLQWRDFDQ